MEKVRKVRKRVVACLMALLLVISGVSLETFTTEAATIQYSGTDGDLSWSIDSDGHLLVEGSGDYVETPSEYPAWFNYRTNIKTATINVSNITNLEFLFGYCSSLEYVDLSGLDTSNVTSMRWMFYGCSQLKNVDLSELKTSNVTNMSCMFYGCNRLTELDLSGMDTSSVTDMSHMFEKCYKLEEINISELDTSNVTTMSYMFGECSSLPNTILSEIDTSNVSDLSYMFNYVLSLEDFDLSKLDTSSATNMSYMFNGCTNLKILNLSGTDTSNVNYMTGMFYGCSSLEELNLSGIDTSSVTEISHMFYGCTGLSSLDLSSLNLSEVTTGTQVFQNCTSLREIKAPLYVGIDISLVDISPALWKDLDRNSYESLPLNLNESITLYHSDDLGYEGVDGELTWSIDKNGYLLVEGSGDFVGGTDGRPAWIAYAPSIKTATVNVTNITNLKDFFYSCENLSYVDLSGLDTTNVTNMASMFSGCSGLTELDLSMFDTTGVTSMASMFSGCSSLTELNLSAFDTTGVTSMASMFSGCSGLTELDLSTFITADVTSMGSMFSGCGSLRELDLSTFETTGVTSMAYMFNNCSSLTELDLSTFNTTDVTDMEYMFNGCNNLVKLNISTFNTAKVTDMSYMFAECNNLLELNLSNFNTSNVTYTDRMFSNCNSLKNLDVTSFNTGKVLYMIDMFYYCSSLTELNLSSFDMSKVTYASRMITGCDSVVRIYSPKNNTHVISTTSTYADSLGTLYNRLPQNKGTSILLYSIEEIATIEIVNLPNKTLYFQGEDLDTTGLVVSLTYTSGYYREFNDSQVSVSGYNKTSVGTQEISVSVGGETTSFMIEVTDSRLSGYTLSLEGDISVNMHMELSDMILVDDNAYMQFTYADGEVSKVYVSEATEKVMDGVTYYIFTCKVQAPEMNDAFTAKMISQSGESKEYTYSVKEYADYILEHTTDSEDYAKAAPMVRAMLNYGGYSQLQFNHNTDALANEGLYTTDTDPVLTETVTISDEYSLPVPSEDIGVQYYGSSLLLNSETTLRHYFTITGDEDITAIRENYTFELADGTTLTPTLYKGMVCVDIKNINAAELDDIFTITVTNTESAETISLSYGAFSYAKYVLEYSLARENLVNVIKAMYLYNAAANEYFG